MPASVISSVSGISSAPPGLVEVVFAERREVGLSFDERVEELPGQPGVGHSFLTVTAIKPGGAGGAGPEDARGDGGAQHRRPGGAYIHRA